ncbi:MAG: hypothetical protein L6R41_008481, partial [Letrouitia leprolyta]
DSNVFSIKNDIHRYIKTPQSYLTKAEANAWIEIYVAYWKAIGEILRAETGYHRDDWAIKVYEAWKEVTELLIRGFSHAGFGAWLMPCLYTAGKYLRVFAIKADEEKATKVGNGTVKMEQDILADDIAVDLEKNERLEDAARVINKIFTLCYSDSAQTFLLRAPIEDSRKWGLYYTTNLLFKTYFKLNSISLSKNCLRALHSAKSDMPPMEVFPKSHIVTFRYYVGVIQFLDEEYSRHGTCVTNPPIETKSPPPFPQSNPSQVPKLTTLSPHRLLLTYLIPTHLHTTLKLPTPSLLSTLPHLAPLFISLLSSIKQGHLYAFSAALSLHESTFVKRRIYLSLERARDICLRNLLRKVWLLEGGKENTRVKVGTFAAGVRFSMYGQQIKTERGEMMIEDEEVECLVAGLIYKNHLKGYISREHATVVLNRKGEAFPGTGV